VSAVRDAVARRDRDSLGHSAHALKGTVMYFEATEAVEAAADLERLSREAEPDAPDAFPADAPRKLTALEREIERLSARLTEILAETGS